MDKGTDIYVIQIVQPVFKGLSKLFINQSLFDHLLIFLWINRSLIDKSKKGSIAGP